MDASLQRRESDFETERKRYNTGFPYIPEQIGREVYGFKTENPKKSIYYHSL